MHGGGLHKNYVDLVVAELRAREGAWVQKADQLCATIEHDKQQRWANDRRRHYGRRAAADRRAGTPHTVHQPPPVSATSGRRNGRCAICLVTTQSSVRVIARII